MLTKKILFNISLTLLAFTEIASAQHSVARQWNEALLQAIREDFARPTIHARNLFHTSIAMYDAWAAYDNTAQPYLLGKTVNGFNTPFQDIAQPVDVEAARREAISYACFRLLNHRFKNSPGAGNSLKRFRNLLVSLGYDPNNMNLDYRNSAAGLGNYLAEHIINYGLIDGANEQKDYINNYYVPNNAALNPISPGNPTMEDPNRWQPLQFDNFIDQSGHIFPHITPKFLSPEWGNVWPFALLSEDLKTSTRDGASYKIYHDPGPPPYLSDLEMDPHYKWNFSLVAIWSSHLSSKDETYWDISPAAMGNMNIDMFPSSFIDYNQFYNYIKGGDIGKGHAVNPQTRKAYEKNLVKRGDYTRVLAEFWADGPDSETPPGHWFTILNYVNDHPKFKKRYKGEGKELGDLEWDVKSYFTLGGAMHDAAISAWSIKGFYDYTRPISAIRYMADHGQSTDPELPNYHLEGIPLVPGYIELVSSNDILAGAEGQHVNKIKIYSWKGPDYIENPETDEAAVGWVLAENWWPYQRPTFITPPFSGYVSGHSTFSRAAAEVLTHFTGDAFFPGGMAEFIAKKNDFLVFEEGPSEDIVLQWATYRDASDQCSLSRIWGGIHPPADDLAGRRIGKKVGVNAFSFAENLFYPSLGSPRNETIKNILVYPNPVNDYLTVELLNFSSFLNIEVIDMQGKIVDSKTVHFLENDQVYLYQVDFLKTGSYILKLRTDNSIHSKHILKQ